MRDRDSDQTSKVRVVLGAEESDSAPADAAGQEPWEMTTPSPETDPGSASESSASAVEGDEAGTQGDAWANPVTLPLLPLPDLVLFPRMVAPLQISGRRALYALSEAFKHGGQLLLLPISGEDDDEETADDAEDGAVAIAGRRQTGGETEATEGEGDGATDEGGQWIEVEFDPSDDGDGDGEQRGVTAETLEREAGAPSDDTGTETEAETEDESENEDEERTADRSGLSQQLALEEVRRRIEQGERVIGVVARLDRISPEEDGTRQALIRGLRRAEVLSIEQLEPFPKADVRMWDDPVPESEDEDVQGLMDEVRAQSEVLVDLMPGVPPSVLEYVKKIDEPGHLADNTAYSPEYSYRQRIELLYTVDPVERLRKAKSFVARHLQSLQLRSEIRNRVRTQVERSQREFLLRQQMRVIQRELGETDPEEEETSELRERIEAAGMPEAPRAKALKELDRLSRQGNHSAEAAVIRNYIDWMVELPWSTLTEDRLDLSEAAQVLDADHYGLERVKERILEYLAVRKLAGEKLKSPILCFVGPPGVGKTSLGKSIARALGRRFVRVSLGGVRDEAEIRGHRRTYVGAMPGRILQGMKSAESTNPVFMLDEIDKVGADFRGDPTSALLEVLDPEQNGEFSDHYLETPFDLSKTLFIATANQLDPIPAPLRDRMEVIRIPGYTEEEKVSIARGFLIPKQREASGLSERPVEIEAETIRALVREYTREAGVRNLEREIGALFRKVARKVVESESDSAPAAETEPEVTESEAAELRISPDQLTDYLGPPKFSFDLAEEQDEVGVATGLAVTDAGGETLSVEVALVEGEGEVHLTGRLGDVMQESARAAITFARSRARRLGLSSGFFEKHDVHVHVPSGAVPKDGPSAGIALATALISALSRRPVRKDVAMTGEVTLRGKVLPIGGLKEKSLAAHRIGVRTVLFPKKNERDLVEVPDDVKRALSLVPVEWMDEVLEEALSPAHDDA